MHYWLVVHPDVGHPLGGVKQIHRLAECILLAGRQVSLIQDSETFHPGWFTSSLPTIAYSDWVQRRDRGELNPDTNVVVVPELYLNALFDYPGKLPVVVFNQNGYYSFGAITRTSYWKPTAVISTYHDKRIVHVLCVSQFDQDLLINGFGLKPESVCCIRNGLEVDLCRPQGMKSRRMAAMPRKNQRDVAVVRDLLKQQPWMDHWEWVEIAGQSHNRVIEQLQSCALFLSFGHPEGFGLPVAEAMACGCAVVGYSGLGGRELFQLGRPYGTVQEVAVGDWLGMVRAAERIDRQLATDPEGFSNRLLAVSKEIRRLYSPEKMLVSVQEALSRIEATLG
jgi:glycosyltransferase involved in cell wall biosynthesis